MSWYIQVWKKFAEFSGRSRRKEYWMFVLFHILVSLVLGIIDATLGLFSAKAGMGLLGGLYALAALIPCLAVAIRRLHDTDRSGWWILIALIPFIGPIVLLVFMVSEGTSGGNNYGPDPKA